MYRAPESIPRMNSACLCSLAGRYYNPLPPRFLAPIDSLKIPALNAHYHVRGGYKWLTTVSILIVILNNCPPSPSPFGDPTPLADGIVCWNDTNFRSEGELALGGGWKHTILLWKEWIMAPSHRALCPNRIYNTHIGQSEFLYYSLKRIW